MTIAPDTVVPTGQPGSGVATANPYVNALLWGGKWGAAWTPVSAGTTTITYAFVNAQAGQGTPTTWSESEKDAMRSALAAWQAVADVRFVEVAGGAGGDASYWDLDGTPVGLDVADLTFDKMRPDEIGPLQEGEIFGFQYGPLDDPWAGLGGYNGSSTPWRPEYLAVGGFAYVTLLHELGHGLGLAHPHDDGGTSGIFPGIDPATPTGRPDLEPGSDGLNQGVWTTMSYRAGLVSDPVAGRGIMDYGHQATPMAFDVAAIQYIYGANTGHATGDDVYDLPTGNGPGTYYACIWDAGGTDTVRHLGADACVIDLRPAPLAGGNAGGYLSRAEGVFGGYTVAAGVILENAAAGAGDDAVTGNDAANALLGGGGADTLSGAPGGDALYGNAGADTLFGGQGADTAYGGQDDDLLYGNLGDDALHGNLGDDRLVGGAGADTLTGGAGVDLFVFTTPGDGGDVITDFEPGVDKIAVASPNFGNRSYGVVRPTSFALDAPTDSTDVFVFDTATGVLSFDADGSGEGAAVALATLNVRTLSASDITILAG
ncbi:M10 family metallopeptidase C-terminal domain-containing protein [Azospirillum sp. ST 5-10]|uniref:M10 family metallopeptidase C-terminal domain-containing protein n=1 Tax=unclassified Azospirillum TaxID=2630922 RepID=UPI003F4A7E0D